MRTSLANWTDSKNLESMTFSLYGRYCWNAKLPQEFAAVSMQLAVSVVNRIFILRPIADTYNLPSQREDELALTFFFFCERFDFPSHENLLSFILDCLQVFRSTAMHSICTQQTAQQLSQSFFGYPIQFYQTHKFVFVSVFQFAG